MRAYLALVLAAGLCCKTDDGTPPPKQVKKGVDMKRIPVPDHSPEKMSDPGEPRKVTANGTIDADIADQKVHFTFLPKGVNAATYAEETKVAWVSIKGQTSSDGGSKLSIKLENVRLDALKLPATFKTTGKNPGDAKLEIRYEVSALKWWRGESGRPSENEAEVTLESFEGSTLTGSFKGKLDPKSSEIGGPLDVKGSFNVDLRLRGVEEGALVDGGENVRG